MCKCICRNGKIITIITKNYLSTNTATAVEKAAEEKQQIQIRATHQIKRYETLLQKRSAQNAVIKFVAVAIPIVVALVVVSSFVQISVLDRVACCSSYRYIDAKRYRYIISVVALHLTKYRCTVFVAVAFCFHIVFNFISTCQTTN